MKSKISKNKENFLQIAFGSTKKGRLINSLEYSCINCGIALTILTIITSYFYFIENQLLFTVFLFTTITGIPLLFIITFATAVSQEYVYGDFLWKRFSLTNEGRKYAQDVWLKRITDSKELEMELEERIVKIKEQRKILQEEYDEIKDL